MEVHLSVVAGIVTYKLAELLVGFGLCYMGYRLFLSGIWGQSGDLETRFGKNGIVLKGAAPGTFFAVLGAGILVFVVYKGISLHTDFGMQIPQG